MNIQEAKDEIIRTVKIYTERDSKGRYCIPLVQQRPLLLIGPPGVGKTAIVRQAAEELEVGLVAYTITHHTRQSAVGLPVVETRTFQGKTVSVTEYTMSEIIASVYACMEETGVREGILFMDEINCVSETLTPTMLQFLQNKTFGTHKVPEGWIIVAAGNPPEYNKSARNFDVVTLDRVKSVRVDVDVTVWRSYAESKGVHEGILSYLYVKPQNFYYVEESRGDREFVTARGWEDLSAMLKAYERNTMPVSLAVVEEYLHCPSIASDFFAYYQLFLKYRSSYRTGDYLKGLLTAEEEREMKERYRKADGEERYSVTQMFLSYFIHACGTYKEQVEEQKKQMDLFHQLQDLKNRSREPDGETLLKEFLEKQDRALEVKREHRLCGEEALALETEVLRRYHALEYRCKEQRGVTSEELLSLIEAEWKKEREDREAKEQITAAELGRSAEFLEQGEDAEVYLGFFLMGLAGSPEAAEFLSRTGGGTLKRHMGLLQYSREEAELKQQLLLWKKSFQKE